MRKIGRIDAYKDEEELQAVVGCLMSLTFLPAADMTQSFVNLQAILSDDSSSKTALKQLLLYTER